jgi:hypothetical protein
MTDELLAVLHTAVDAVIDVLARQEDWSLTGLGNNQYHHDTVADAAAIAVLDAAGLAIFSEESGVHNPERPVMVVIDPVDGSTNASRGLPWWAVSLCALDSSGPLAAAAGRTVRGSPRGRCPPQREDDRPEQGGKPVSVDHRLQRLPGFPLRLGPVPVSRSRGSGPLRGRLWRPGRICRLQPGVSRPLGLPRRLTRLQGGRSPGHRAVRARLGGASTWGKAGSCGRRDPGAARPSRRCPARAEIGLTSGTRRAAMVRVRISRA